MGRDGLFWSPRVVSKVTCCECTGLKTSIFLIKSQNSDHFAKEKIIEKRLFIKLKHSEIGVSVDL